MRNSIALMLGCIIGVYGCELNKKSLPNPFELHQIYISKNLNEYKNYSYRKFRLKELETNTVFYCIYYPYVDFWFIFDSVLEKWTAVDGYYIEVVFEREDVTFENTDYYPFTTVF